MQAGGRANGCWGAGRFVLLLREGFTSLNYRIRIAEFGIDQTLNARGRPDQQRVNANTVSSNDDISVIFRR